MSLETDVLIVGAGPTGLLAALMLHEQGLRVIVLDRRLERSQAPRAHAVNPRTLEICDAIGLSAQELRATGAPREEAGHVRFLATLTGAQFGVLPYERQQDDVLDLTPFPLSNLAQPDFEAAIATRLGRCPRVALLRGCEWHSCTQDDSGVTTTAQLGGEATTIRSQYLLGADGAGSSVRDAIGVELEGLRDLQHHMMVHFEADLRPLIAERPGMLHFIFQPEFSCVLLGFDAARSWVLMHTHDPSTETREDYTPERCQQLVERALGTSLAHFRLRHVSPWSMCAEVANAYRAGRVFLIGDAAHRFPPTGGLGLNTGVVDAWNLAWKIAATIRGDAGPALLDSYEAERRPVAQRNTQQSLTNSSRLLELFGALYGPDPAGRAARMAAIEADVNAFPEVAQAVTAQEPHFDSLDLQLGYRYVSAVLPGAEAAPDNDDISNFQPCWALGAHVPHRWVETDGGRCSLLSLLDAYRFNLLLGPGAEDVEVPNGVAVLKWGKDCQDPASDWKSLTNLEPGGALLLRPDRHICARLPATDLATSIEQAHRIALGRGAEAST